MRKALLFGSAILLLAGCASTARSVSRGQAAPISLVVITQAPLRQSDADLFRAVIEDYLHRYVRDGQPLTLTVTLDPNQMDLSGDVRDVSSNGYRFVETSGGYYPGGHTVPLVGGMTVAEVGYQPRVGGGGGGGFGSSRYLGGWLMATYSIADATGRVIESRRFPLYPMAYVYGPPPMPGQTLQALHDTASLLAKRVATAH